MTLHNKHNKPQLKQMIVVYIAIVTTSTSIHVYQIGPPTKTDCFPKQPSDQTQLAVWYQIIHFEQSSIGGNGDEFLSTCMSFFSWRNKVFFRVQRSGYWCARSNSKEPQMLIGLTWRNKSVIKKSNFRIHIILKFVNHCHTIERITII